MDDLTRFAPGDVLAICRALVTCGGLLHGSVAAPVSLVPRQANDAAKASGNRCAVYATTCAESALLHAVTDHAHLRRCFDSYTIGDRPRPGGCGFVATDNVCALVRCGDPALFTDGFVHVLDPAAFTRSPDSAVEHTADTPQVPLRTLRVGAEVGWHLVATCGWDPR